MLLTRILGFATAHFALAYAAAIIANGWDLDRVYLNPVSRAAAGLYAVLMLPYSAFIHSLPAAWLERFQSFLLFPVLANSLLSGIALTIVVRLVQKVWRRTHCTSVSV